MCLVCCFFLFGFFGYDSLEKGGILFVIHKGEYQKRITPFTSKSSSWISLEQRAHRTHGIIVRQLGSHY